MGHCLPLLVKGLLKPQNKLVLNFALHAPNLSCNLVAMSKLTSDLNCVVKFFPTYCESQDQYTKKRIGNAREVNGLIS